MLAAVSNAVSKIHSESYGRGARSAHTIMQRLRRLLHERHLHAGQRTFIDAGRFEHVRQTRLEFQTLMRDRFSDAVEEAIGRRVIAFFSQVHKGPDMSIEGFVLDPQATTDGQPPAS